MVNGFFGYSLLDDQLSGTGLRIVYAIVLSIPVIGTWIVVAACSAATFPVPRRSTASTSLHILLVPALIGVLIAVHLAILVRHKHTHYPGPGQARRQRRRRAAVADLHRQGRWSVLPRRVGPRRARRVWRRSTPSGSRALSGQADVSSASQPDWYMGWTEGGLRLMPPFEIRAFGFEIPNPFFPGVLLPTVVFGILYLWPFIEQRVSKTTGEHHLLFRPRDHPVHTGIGVAAFAFIAVMLLAGSSDVIAATFGLSVNAVIWTLRTALLVVPPIAGLIAARLCVELRDRDVDRPRPATGGPPTTDPAPADALVHEPASGASEAGSELATGVARATAGPPGDRPPPRQ